MEYRQINYEERIKIQVLFLQNLNFTAIGKAVGKHPTSIKREIQRNSVSGEYDPNIAHRLYCARKAANVKRSFDNPFLRYIVRILLSMLWSPEQISGRLKLFKIAVSTETIYKWIYSQIQLGLNFYQYLRINKTRQKRGLKYHRRALNCDKKSIHDRPDLVNNKKRIGDWEGDTIEGQKNSGFIATFVERKSLVIIAAKMKDKCAATFNKAALYAFAVIDFIYTLTLDHGTEMSYHKDLQDALDCDIYFADPGRPGQRGVNENSNGLLRQFFFKGMDFNKVSQRQIDKAIYMMNNRPRKSLGYRTPLEVYHGLKPNSLTSALRL